MSEVIHPREGHKGHSSGVYSATGRASSRSGLSWRASVFLLAGALVVASAMFGSNDDSSAPAVSVALTQTER